MRSSRIKEELQMKNMKVLAEEIHQGKHDEILKESYVDECVLEYQRNR